METSAQVNAGEKGDITDLEMSPLATGRLRNLLISPDLRYLLAL